MTDRKAKAEPHEPAGEFSNSFVGATMTSQNLAEKLLTHPGASVVIRSGDTLVGVLAHVVERVGTGRESVIILSGETVGQRAARALTGTPS